MEVAKYEFDRSMADMRDKLDKLEKALAWAETRLRFCKVCTRVVCGECRYNDGSVASKRSYEEVVKSLERKRAESCPVKQSS